MRVATALLLVVGCSSTVVGAAADVDAGDVLVEQLDAGDELHGMDVSQPVDVDGDEPDAGDVLVEQLDAGDELHGMDVSQPVDVDGDEPDAPECFNPSGCPVSKPAPEACFPSGLQCCYAGALCWCQSSGWLCS
jgi:hypothetical protein